MAERRQLKIMHLTASLAFGGGERFMMRLAKHTDKAQFEVHICVFDSIEKTSILPDLQALALPFHLIPLQRFYDPRVIWSIIRYIRKNRIDVIHTHLIDADILGRLAGWITRTPVISKLGSTPQGYDRNRLDRRWLARITARHNAAHLVAVSSCIRHLFIKYWHIPEENISYIHNGISLDNFSSIAAGTEKNGTQPLTITNVASLNPQKGQDVLLEAAKKVLTQCPNTRFMIVGQGRLDTALRTKAQALGIAEQVAFTGLRQDIPQILAQADIFVLPSLWEGLPNAAIEAMAAARPVVLTAVGGNPELIEPGTQGLLIPPGDANALADALLTLLQDESRRLSMGQAARERAFRDFNIEKKSRQYGKLYQTVWQQYHQRTIPSIEPITSN